MLISRNFCHCGKKNLSNGGIHDLWAVLGLARPEGGPTCFWAVLGRGFRS